MDAAVNSLAAMSKSVQAIAIDAADYFKKSFEQVAATAENLVGAKSLDKAIEVQTEYVKMPMTASCHRPPSSPSFMPILLR